MITNVIYHWEEEQQFLCSFQAWSFTSYSIRIWLWTVCSWHWKPTSAQFNFLVMTLKQPSGYMVELSTFLTWWMKEVIGHKTLSLLNSKIMVNHIWCKVCAPHENVNQLWINWKEMQNRVTGFHPGNKCGNQTPGMDFFFCKTLKLLNCLISAWNGSSQLQFFFKVFLLVKN